MKYPLVCIKCYKGRGGPWYKEVGCIGEKERERGSRDGRVTYIAGGG